MILSVICSLKTNQTALIFHICAHDRGNLLRLWRATVDAFIYSKCFVADDSCVVIEIKYGLILLDLLNISSWSLDHLKHRARSEKRLILKSPCYLNQFFGISSFLNAWISDCLFLLSLLSQYYQYLLNLRGERRCRRRTVWLLSWHRNVTLVEIIVLKLRSIEETLRTSLYNIRPEFKPWMILYWHYWEWGSLLNLFVWYGIFTKHLNMLVRRCDTHIVNMGIWKFSAGGLAWIWSTHFWRYRRVCFESCGTLQSFLTLHGRREDRQGSIFVIVWVWTGASSASTSKKGRRFFCPVKFLVFVLTT